MKKQSFSLIELLVVISIITILAAMVIGGLSAVSEKNDIADTKSTIMLLQDAMLKYYQNNGEYPGGGTGRSTGIAKSHDSSSIFENSLFKTLVSLGAKPDIIDGEEGFYDAWGNPLWIIYPDNYLNSKNP